MNTQNTFYDQSIKGLYSLPEGWKWVRLGEVAEKPQYGYTYAAISEPVGPKFLRISDIQDGKVDWENVPYCRCDHKILAKYRLGRGDILFARSGATTGKTFLVNELPYDAVFASYLIRIRVKREELLPEYAFWFFQSPQYWEQVRPRGAAQPNMNAQALRQLLLPLAPINEQKRIVEQIEAISEQVKEAKRLIEDALRDADSLLPAFLHQIFSQAEEKGWKWVRLGEIVTEIQTGFAFAKRKLVSEGVPHLRPYNIEINGELDLSQLVFVPPEIVPTEYDGLKRGDILFNNTNSVELVGKTAMVREDLFAVFSNHITRIRVNPSLVLPEWVTLALQYLWQKGYFSTHCHRWVGQAGFNTDLLKRKVFVPLPLNPDGTPNLSEQRKIVEQIEVVREKVEALKSELTQVLNALNALLPAVLNKAFRGEL